MFHESNKNRSRTTQKKLEMKFKTHISRERFIHMQTNECMRHKTQ